MTEKLLVLKKLIRPKKTNKRIIKHQPEVGDKIEFVWYDRDLVELTGRGEIIAAPENLPVVKVLGSDQRIYIIAREWIKGEIMELDETSVPKSPGLDIFANENL